MTDKKTVKLEIAVIMQGKIEVLHISLCNLKSNASKTNSAVFHNGFNYDYDFIIKELAKELKRQLTCLGENTKKCMAFTVSTEKIDKNDKNTNW